MQILNSLIFIFFNFLPLVFLGIYYLGLKYYPRLYNRLFLMMPGLAGLLFCFYLLSEGNPVQLHLVGSLALVASALIASDPYAVLALSTLSLLAMLIGSVGLDSSAMPASPMIFVGLAIVYIASYTLFQVINTLRDSRALRLALFMLTLLAWTVSTIIYIINSGVEALGYTVFQLSAVIAALALLMMWPAKSTWASFIGAAAILAALSVDVTGMLSGTILGSSPYGLLLLFCIITLAYQVLVVYRVVYRIKGVTPMITPGAPSLVLAVGLIALIAGLLGLVTGQIRVGEVSGYIADVIILTSLMVPLLMIVRSSGYSPAIVVGSVMTAWATYEASVQLKPSLGYLIGVAAAWVVLVLIYAVISRNILRPAIAALAVVALVIIVTHVNVSLWNDLVELNMPTNVGETTGATGLSGTLANLSVRGIESSISATGPCMIMDVALELNPPNTSKINQDLDLTVNPGTGIEDLVSLHESYIIKGPSVVKVEVSPSTSLVGGMLASCDYAGLTGTIYEELITGSLQVNVTKYNNVIALPVLIACIAAVAVVIDLIISKNTRR